MIELIGSALVILSCGCMGAAAAAGLARRERQTRETLRMMVRLRTEVCICRRSLPEALERIGKENDLEWVYDDRPFREAWDSCARRILPTGPALEALRDLGQGLSGGETPEPAFDRCIQALESAAGEEREKRRRYARVWVALGFAVGGALTLLLIG